MARTYKRDARGRFASGGGGSSEGRKSSGGKRSTPKTTTARGRALQNQRRASDLVRAGRGGSGPSKKAVRSAVTAMRARAYYAATGTGTKRSARKAVSSTKKGERVRAEAQKKAAGARTAKESKETPAQKRAARLRARASQLRQQGNALMGGNGNRDTAVANVRLSSRARSQSIDAGLRGLEMTRRADQLESRARGVEIRAAQSAAKAARDAAKPKRTRSQASARASRARSIVTRREQKISGTRRQWENSVRTERRALAFLKAKPLPLTGQQQFWRDMVK